MKLENFNNNKDLNRILDKIGAKRHKEFSIKTKINYLDPLEVKKLNTVGIEIDIKDLRISDDLTFEYKGQKIIIYIKNQWQNPNYPDKNYKFHIAQCVTIDDMNSKGKGSRYVISTKKDGYFLVNLTNPVTRELYSKDEEKKLNVCKNCLKTLTKFYNDDKIFTYDNFTISKYLDKYETKHRKLPKHNSLNSPLNEYTPNFKELSKNLKIRAQWKCEECGKDKKNDKANLHTHHKNAIKNDNRPSNLQVLCFECHSKKDNHHTLKKR